MNVEARELVRELSKEKFLDLIRVEGMHYEPSEYDVSRFSNTIDPSLEQASPALFHDLQTAVDICLLYLPYPTIIDDMPSHEVRRDWKSAMITQFGSKFPEYYSQNKLKGNPLAGLYEALSIVKDDIPANIIPSAQLAELRTILARVPEEWKYPEMDKDDKLIFVKIMSDVAYDLLRLVTVPGHEYA